MLRLERLRKHGWKVTLTANEGKYHATKNNGLTRRTSTSITALHRLIFGY